MNENHNTLINAANGEQHTCILKEKVNNSNGKLIYRFRNQNNGEEYLLAKDAGGWQPLNNCPLPENNIRELTEFADGLDQ